MPVREILIPDIGQDKAVDVIEVLVAAGDHIAVDDPLLTLETDKASMDVPSSGAGVVKELKVKVGDKVAEGDLILILEGEGGLPEHTHLEKDKPEVKPEAKPLKASSTVERVPDVGGAAFAKVTELLVKAGDTVSVDDPLLILETDKTAMEVPATETGIIESILVTIGEIVKPGDPVVAFQHEESTAVAAPAAKSALAPSSAANIELGGSIYASPSVRRLAREQGIDLTQVEGSGRKGRITKEDLANAGKPGAKAAAPAKAAAAGDSMGIPAMPAVDFSAFGETEPMPLSRIQKISGPHLHRVWLNMPMVTYHDEADITELEAFRQSLKKEAEAKGVKVTPLAFIVKALTYALQAFPRFNASLDNDGETLLLKKYYNIGIAVDTPNGLMVPVIKGTDQLSIYGICEAMADLSSRARDSKLGPKDLSGGCMSISSLGGIGGTAFTPIINAPEVAILGVTRSAMKPVWDGKEFQPRLMCPLDITFDHRVIDGAEAARFMSFLCQCLTDVRRLLL